MPADSGADRGAAEIMNQLPVVRAPLIFDKADRFYSYKKISLLKALGEATLKGDVAEFGVYKGRCAKIILSLLAKDRKLHLFDSFEGLPEDWIGPWKKGAFKLDPESIPVFRNPRVRVVKGWFADTVPNYFKQGSPLGFVHIDCDLYQSTLDVLENIDSNLHPGTIVLFDEYMMKSEDQSSDDEHRALQKYARRYGREFSYLWRTEWMQVAIRIEK